MKNSCVLSVMLLAACVSSALSADGAGWFQWRGPQRDGISTDKGLLKEWPEGGPKLLWKATGLGLGYSTVSVIGDRLYTMGEKGDANFLIALNAKDGKPVWTTRVGKAGAPGWGGFAGPRAQPTVDGDLVFGIGQYGEVVCVSTDGGREIWRKSYIDDFGGEVPEWGFAGMPLVDGDQVIVMPGGKDGDLAALNKKTGERIWQSKELTDSIHYSSPIVAEIGGVRQYIQLTDAHVAGIAAKDGKLLWAAERKGATAVIPTPIYSHGYVYVSSSYGSGSDCFKVTARDGKFSVESVYSNKVMVNHHGGVIQVGPNVYGYSDSKGWTCQDLRTGKAVWQEKGKLGKGSLTFADGMFYLRSEEGKDGKGTVALIEASPDGYKEHGRFDQPNLSGKNTWPHPVIIDGRLYLRDQDVLLCYSVKK